MRWKWSIAKVSCAEGLEFHPDTDWSPEEWGLCGCSGSPHHFRGLWFHHLPRASLSTPTACSRHPFSPGLLLAPMTHSSLASSVQMLCTLFYLDIFFFSCNMQNCSGFESSSHDIPVAFGYILPFCLVLFFLPSKPRWDVHCLTLPTFPVLSPLLH